LEPGQGKELKVAVVGVSNFSLDPAKMSRAIRLSRPDPDVNDLVKTVTCLVSTFVSHPRMLEGLKEQVTLIAKQFSEYFNIQPIQSFHGLRDLYAVAKSIGRHHKDADQHNVLVNAIARNLGGLPQSQGFN